MRPVSVLTIAEAEMVFFRHLSNGQSAAAWVLCGVLLYVYEGLDDRGEKLREEREKRQKLELFGRPSSAGPRMKE